MVLHSDFLEAAADVIDLQRITQKTDKSCEILDIFQIEVFADSRSLTTSLERVVVSQNEFWDSPLAYFNVFFLFRSGFVFFNFWTWAIFWG